MKTRFFFSATFLAGFLICSVADASEPGEMLSVRRIEPLFHCKCLACHGRNPNAIAGSSDMSSLSGFVRGGDSGEPALIAGLADETPIYLAACRDSVLRRVMPPKDAE